MVLTNDGHQSANAAAAAAAAATAHFANINYSSWPFSVAASIANSANTNDNLNQQSNCKFLYENYKLRINN